MPTHINIKKKRAQTDVGKGKKKKKKAMKWWIVRIEQTKNYCIFYTFTQQALLHFQKTFIFSPGWSQSYSLLFYFDL